MMRRKVPPIAVARNLGPVPAPVVRFIPPPPPSPESVKEELDDISTVVATQAELVDFKTETASRNGGVAATSQFHIGRSSAAVASANTEFHIVVNADGAQDVTQLLEESSLSNLKVSLCS